MAHLTLIVVLVQRKNFRPHQQPTADYSKLLANIAGHWRRFDYGLSVQILASMW